MMGRFKYVVFLFVDGQYISDTGYLVARGELDAIQQMHSLFPECDKTKSYVVSDAPEAGDVCLF